MSPYTTMRSVGEGVWGAAQQPALPAIQSEGSPTLSSVDRKRGGSDRKTRGFLELETRNAGDNHMLYFTLPIFPLQSLAEPQGFRPISIL